MEARQSRRLSRAGGADPYRLGAAAGKPALLVWERDHAMVLETCFPIMQGEHVRVDSYLGEDVRVVWGVVVEGREGHRAEDQANGVHVHWLHVR